MKLKLRRTLRGNIKAVSPVIATIIIVAIAITMSIAVAYWLLGLGGSFTRFEKVEFATGYADVGVAPATYDYLITLNIKNTGSATATIDPTLILYNGRPLTFTEAVVYYGTQEPNAREDIITAADMANLVLNPGDSDTIKIEYTGDASSDDWESGMTLEVTLHTTGGKDYPKAIVLP